MEIANETYEAVDINPCKESYSLHDDKEMESYVDPAVFDEKPRMDKNLRPESYINPLAIKMDAYETQSRPEYYVDPSTLKDGCDGEEEENYETLAEVQTMFNIYEAPPTVKTMKKRPQPVVKQCKEETVASCDAEKGEIGKIKDELRKIKLLVLVFGLILVLTVLLSLTAVVLSTMASTRTLSTQNVVLGPDAQAAQQTDNSGLIRDEIFAEFEKVYTALNASRDEVDREINEHESSTWQNLSEILVEVNGLRKDLSSNVSRLEQQQSTSQLNISSLNQQVDQLQNRLGATQGDIETVNRRLTNVQTSINNRLDSPVNLYQNCRIDTTNCTSFTATNSNRRLVCDTPALQANITGFYTLDMRCEYTGTSQLEAPSLQFTNSGYYCQCSILTPSSDGFARLSASRFIGTCKLVVTRCPLSQTVT